MNGGATKLSELQGRKEMENFSLIFGFCQFPPLSLSGDIIMTTYARFAYIISVLRLMRKVTESQ